MPDELEQLENSLRIQQKLGRLIPWVIGPGLVVYFLGFVVQSPWVVSVGLVSLWLFLLAYFVVQWQTNTAEGWLLMFVGKPARVLALVGFLYATVRLGLMVAAIFS